MYILNRKQNRWNRIQKTKTIFAIFFVWCGRAAVIEVDNVWYVGFGDYFSGVDGTTYEERSTVTDNAYECFNNLISTLAWGPAERH